MKMEIRKKIKEAIADLDVSALDAEWGEILRDAENIATALMGSCTEKTIAMYMDDRIREDLHYIGFKSFYAFLVCYCIVHVIKFGEDFSIE